MARVKKKVVKKFDPYSILEAVKSSNILKMGYHEGITYVLYHNNRLYQFEGFDLELYGRIRKAESIGKALLKTGVKGKPCLA